MLDRFDTFTGYIFAIYRDIQKIQRREMEKQGLKGAYAQYLLALSRHPEGLTAAQLTEECEKDKAAVSRALTELEQKDLVTKSQGANSYRACLTLTAAGKEMAEFVAKQAAHAVALASQGLPEADRPVFYGALSRISSILESVAQEGLKD